ncbi:MAG: amidohydrolase [Clostridiales bacterium]|nr:amidohydrolase [Clostridiales bacterium]
MSYLFKNANILTSDADEKKQLFVAVDKNTITYVGPDRPQGSFDRTIDCTGKLLCPGFYNVHCHSPMTLFRGYGEDLPLDKWLTERIFPAEDHLTPESTYSGSMLAIAEMISCGTVSFTDMYMFPEMTAKAVSETGIKANLTRPVLSFDPNEKPEDNFRFSEAKSFAEEFNGEADGRIIVDMSVHAEYTNTERSVRFTSEYALEHGLLMQMHLSETEKEHRECIERHGTTPAGFFLRCGAFDVPASAAHCVWVTDEDISIMAEKGVTAVHNPASNLKLGSGVMPIRKMLDGGVNIALGTDGASSNNMLDIISEMRLAAILHKGISRNASETRSSEMVPIITVNGARSQGRNDCGMIKPGFKADIVLLDMDSVNTIPSYDICASFAYSMKSDNVFMTMADGKILYENGEYLTLDIEKVKHEFRYIQEHYFDYLKG